MAKSPTPQPEIPLPPLDSDDGLAAAVSAIKQIRRLLKRKFGDDPKWPAYIANSLAADYARKMLPLDEAAEE